MSLSRSDRPAARRKACKNLKKSLLISTSFYLTCNVNVPIFQMESCICNQFVQAFSLDGNDDYDKYDLMVDPGMAQWESAYNFVPCSV